MGKLKLSKTTVEKLQPVEGVQAIYWDQDITGFGVRVSPGGSRSFFYQGRLNGMAKKITIGKLGRITAETARKEAKRIASMLELGQDPTRKKEGKTTGSTFGDLLEAYVELLESQGKLSAKAVSNAIKKDVETAFPKLWKKAANAITLDDCMDIVGRLKDEGKSRQADKIRSYIRTAFSEAINARGDVNMPASMRKLGITFNPARDMRKVKGSSNAKDRALSLAEFRAYWKHTQELPEPKRSLALLHVLTGGQRQQQLARVTLADIDRDAPSLTIWDSKGRRAEPRRHVVPLLPVALDAIDEITGGGEFVFSCDGGKSPIHIAYLNDLTKATCQKMQDAGELEGAPFTAGTIRATIETRLIAKPYSVTSDVLAHLLSHGMGGIQQRHYQHHDFFDEKLDALQKLHGMLTQPRGKVTAIRGRKQA
ncbi:MAG: integrase family protein [Gammaproteobacteria bacterium]|nr:integrase family protein [Gammaproteobacteria bacterium]